MTSFFKNASVVNLKTKLTYIYILNALDILFTFSLLKTGLFEEVNFLMVNVVNSALLSILVKLVIPAILMIYILLKLNEFSDIHLPFCNFSINIVLFVYSFIFLMHLCYTAFFIYTLI